MIDEQQHNLATIGQSGEYLLSLINEVLEFSKIEDGKMEVQEEDFDLQLMIMSIDEMFRNSAEEKLLQLNVIREEGVPRHIRTDLKKLRQVWTNLLSNALKCTDTGKIDLRVKRTGWETGTGNKVQLCFEVEDTGRGIAPEDIQSIFQAFFQKSPKGAPSSGTGLGLAISQKFVRVLGGELQASSQVGKGTLFSFEIQVEELQDSDDVEKHAVQRAKGLVPGQESFRILVVEDNKSSRDLLASYDDATVRIVENLPAEHQNTARTFKETVERYEFEKLQELLA